jgi:hypothetical protein
MFKTIGCFTTFCFVGFIGLVIMSPSFQEGFKQGYEAGNISYKQQKVSYGNFSVYYDDEVGKELAQKALNVMVLFTDASLDDPQKDMFIIKEANTYQIKLTMRTGVVLDGKMKASMGYMAHKLSNEVFEGAPVETHICDPNMVTQEIIFPIGELEAAKEIIFN